MWPQEPSAQIADMHRRIDVAIASLGKSGIHDFVFGYPADGMRVVVIPHLMVTTALWSVPALQNLGFSLETYAYVLVYVPQRVEPKEFAHRLCASGCIEAFFDSSLPLPPRVCLLSGWLPVSRFDCFFKTELGLQRVRGQFEYYGTVSAEPWMRDLYTRVDPRGRLALENARLFHHHLCRSTASAREYASDVNYVETQGGEQQARKRFRPFDYYEFCVPKDRLTLARERELELQRRDAEDAEYVEMKHKSKLSVQVRERLLQQKRSNEINIERKVSH